MFDVPVDARDADAVVALGADDARHVGAVAAVVVRVVVVGEEVRSEDVVAEPVRVVVGPVGRIARVLPGVAGQVGVLVGDAGVHDRDGHVRCRSSRPRRPWPRCRRRPCRRSGRDCEGPTARRSCGRSESGWRAARSWARRSRRPGCAAAARVASSVLSGRPSRAPRRSTRSGPSSSPRAFCTARFSCHSVAEECEADDQLAGHRLRLSPSAAALRSTPTAASASKGEQQRHGRNERGQRTATPAAGDGDAGH